ncbi:RNA polymerase sigma factor [Croceiramulus getboli]|nr:RNA polymerase sigma factor [Flavobacteriaceae bacterium YJPT1-3]
MTATDFDSIYKDHYDAVFRLCLGYVSGDEDTAKDLTQESFVKVFQNLPSFRQEAALGTWIYRITVNTCLAFLRKKKNGQHPIMNTR